MSSTDGVATEDEHLLSDPETRAERAHTGRSVARFLASVVTFAVCFVLALHALFGPDIATAVSRRAEPAEAAAETSRREERREAESLLSSIERIAHRDDALESGARRVAHDPASLGREDVSESAEKTSSVAARPARPDEPETLETPAWDVPLYLVGVSEAHDGDGDDRARADENVARLARTFGEAATLANVRALDGVDAKEWPNEGLKETIDALRSVFDVLSSGDAAKTKTKSNTKSNTPDLTLLKPLPWVEAVASREKKTGRLAKPWTDEAVAPSLGRLFSHMRAWQSAYDAGHEKAFFVENGALSGLRPSHLGVPLVAFPAIAKNAPEDFDLVVLNQPLFSGDASGPLKTFADAFGNVVEIRRWRQRGVAGAGAYLFSEGFVKKVFTHVAKHGADAPDAWLLDLMCASDSLDENGVFVGFDARDAREPALRCYKAAGVVSDAKDDVSFQSESTRITTTTVGETEDANRVAAVGAETAEIRKRMRRDERDARFEAARERRAYVDARAAETARVRAYVEKAGIRTTQDTV
jgi:cell division protein FtsB